MESVASSSNSVSFPDPNQEPLQRQQHLQQQEATGENSMPVKTESASAVSAVEDDSTELKRAKTESDNSIVGKRQVVEAPADKSIMADEDQVETFKKDEIEKFKEDECEKLKKYEADYKQYLISKYFSDKTIFGGNIFDVKMNADGESIRSSRLPVYQSYLDPMTFHTLLDGKESVSPAETATIAINSNGTSSTHGI